MNVYVLGQIAFDNLFHLVKFRQKEIIRDRGSKSAKSNELISVTISFPNCFQFYREAIHDQFCWQHIFVYENLEINEMYNLSENVENI